MKAIVSFFAFVALAHAAINLLDSNPNCPRARIGEIFLQCGRLCEVTCKNIGDDLEAPLPLVLDGPQEELCSPAKDCNRPQCLQGLIYDNNGICVTQTPLSCPSNPCAGQKNRVWRKCALKFDDACYTRTCTLTEVAVQSRCVCMAGYAVNLQNECIRKTSPACCALADKQWC